MLGRVSTAEHGRYASSALPDRPVWDRPDGKRLAVSLAVDLEVDDGRGRGAELAPGGVSGQEAADVVVATVDEMVEQPRCALAMGIALHPHVVGHPHRLRPLPTALTHVAARRDEVRLTTAGAIAAHTATVTP
ncbi:MAG: polysaccharide deacetylase [Klenkia sp.]|nr:polysaccharide deacetylase [Klenkia sp.]